MDFQTAYMGAFPPDDERYQTALKVWLTYYVATEMYDRRVCSASMPDGTAVPTDGRERGMIGSNAEKLQRVAYCALENAGVPVDVAQRARRDAQRRTFEEQQLLASRH